MIEKRFEKKDGTEGISYKLEVGDKFTYKEIQTWSGMYGPMIHCITNEDKKIRLTDGQAMFFERFDVVPGSKLIADGYTNKYGPQVGITFADKKSPVQKSSGLPNLGPASVAEMSQDEKNCLTQLAENEKYQQWKTFASENVANFTEAMQGVAQELGVKIEANAERVEKLFEQFKEKL